MMLVGTALQGRMVGQYMVASGGDSPNRIKVFDIETKEVGTYTIKDNVVTMPSLSTSFTVGYRWNPQGTTLAVTHSNSPYLQMYNKIGNVYTNISPSANGNKAALKGDWHPNGNLYAVGRSGSNSTGQVQLWERIGDTFRTTGTFNVAVTATFSIGMVAWNPQGTSLAMCIDGANPWCMIYNFNPETKEFTKITTPFSTGPTTTVLSAAWNHDGSSLALATRQTNTQLQIFNREGDNFVRCFTANLGAFASDVAWGGYDGSQLVVGVETAPRVYWYYREPGTTSTFHRAANPAVAPPNNAVGVGMSPDGLFSVVTVYLNATKYYRRDPATTSTWIDIGQNISGNPVYGKDPHIFPGTRL